MGRQCSQSRRLAALTILPQVCQQDCPSIRQSAVTRTRHIHSRSRHARCITHAHHTAHRSARHHIDTRSAHSHAHAPQPVRRQGGALAKFLRPRLPRTATRRSAPVYPCTVGAFLCFSAPSPLPETQARGTSTRALASSTYMTHVLT